MPFCQRNRAAAIAGKPKKNRILGTTAAERIQNQMNDKRKEAVMPGHAEVRGQDG